MNKENNHDFEKSSSILFILMMVANGFNYLFQIVMGRMMEVDIYGELNSLMSIFTIVTLPSLVFNLVVSKYVSEYNQQKRGMVLKFIRNIAVYIIIISVSMIFLGIIWAKKIAGYINVSDEKIIVLLFVVAVAATFSSLVLGTLQGLKRFFCLWRDKFGNAYF